MARTRVFPHKYSKNSPPLFAVFKVDKAGEKINGEEAIPLASMGIKKAKAFAPFSEELKEFVEENDD